MRTSSFVRSTQSGPGRAPGGSPAAGGLDATNAAPDLSAFEAPGEGDEGRAGAAAAEHERASEDVFASTPALGPPPSAGAGARGGSPAPPVPSEVEPRPVGSSPTPSGFVPRPSRPAAAAPAPGRAPPFGAPSPGRGPAATPGRPRPGALPLFAQRARSLMAARGRREGVAPIAQMVGEAVSNLYAIAVSTALLAYLLGELYVRYAHVFLKAHYPGGPPPGAGLFSPETLVACSPVAVVCALPTLLSYSLVAAGQRSLDTRLTFDVPGGPSSSREAEWAPSFVEARLRWRHEARHVTAARKRIAQHGRLYGFLVSLLLSLCAMVGARQVLFGEAPAGQPARVALAVATALLINFARDLGRMAVRVANRDASSRMLAWSIKRLLMTAIGTLLLSGFAFAGALPETLQGPAGWLLIGGAMALFADQVMDAVGDRFAALFGVTRPPQLAAESLRRLDGMGEDDLDRLGEEGIDSVHALAMCSTPKLFFNTPYALQRICDWQDQALLMVRLGEAKARLFREQLQLRGAVDAQRLALDFVRGQRLGEKERQDLVKVLGFASEEQARTVLERLACDDMIRQLACFRKALPFDVNADDRAPSYELGPASGP